MISVPEEKIKLFCLKWRIKELSFFGSVLRDDFAPESDIDVLIDFLPDASWGWDVVDMKNELASILGRNIDFVSKSAILSSENPYRKNEILNSAKVIYEQAS